jgi:hypothetical protein
MSCSIHYLLDISKKHYTKKRSWLKPAKVFFSIGLLIGESIMLLCRTKAELKGLNLAMRAFSSYIKADIS